MIQAVLTPSSVAKLKKTLNEIEGMLFEREFVHHVTVGYKPNEAFIQMVEDVASVGDHLHIKTRRHVYSDSFGVEAVEVDVYSESGEDVPVMNENPHITITTAEGVAPVKSNNLLSSPEEYGAESTDIDLFLEGILTYER
jgi:2'-5' RNA ligase